MISWNIDRLQQITTFVNVNYLFIVWYRLEFSRLHNLHPLLWNSLLYNLISSGENSAFAHFAAAVANNYNLAFLFHQVSNTLIAFSGALPSFIIIRNMVLKCPSSAISLNVKTVHTTHTFFQISRVTCHFALWWKPINSQWMNCHVDECCYTHVKWHTETSEKDMVGLWC